MAKFDIQELNYITAGKSQNTFNITYRYTNDGMIQISDKSKWPETLSVSRTHTFFGNIGEYDTMSDKYNSNKESFYDITQNILIHNLYNINKVTTKTSAKKIGLINEYKDIYIPYISSDFINVCQYKSNAYGLTHPYMNNPLTITNIYNNVNNFDITYYNNISSDNFHTYLYPKPQELMSECSTYTDVIENAMSLSNTYISSIFKPNKDLLGVEHNYIVEIPETKPFIDYYVNGHLLGNSSVTKNHLNYQYTLCTNNDYGLSGCREYCNINVCGGKLYMTYRDNIHYIATSNETITYYDDLNSTSSNDLSIEQYQLSKRRTNYNYQHVEVIESLNKFDNDQLGGHKSSMFSIKLVDTGLNESSIPEEAKIKLRQNIEHNVRSIIDKLIPANTQLFKIYFEGK